MKLVFPLAVGFCIALWPCRAASQVKPAVPSAPPVTQPVNSIVEVTLEDPLKPQSKCYIDFDSGKTFSYSESTPEDLDLSRQWLKKSGVDLMSESRSPADGFVAYDMTLVETEKKLEDINSYAEVSKALQSAEAQGFNAVNVGLILPRTYLFRTREGEIGGLEVTSIDEKSHGLQMRYKVIHQPIPEQPQNVTRRGRAIPIPMMIEAHKANLKKLQQTLPDNNPTIIREKLGIKYLEDLQALNDELLKPGADRMLNTLKRERLSAQVRLDLIKDRMQEGSPELASMKRTLEKLDQQIKLREDELVASTQPSVKPTTKPLIFVQ